jgi:hypothetical protein
MVHVTDDGEFDAPIDKIWKYLGDDNPQTHAHSTVKGQKVLENKPNYQVLEMEVVNPDGKSTRKEKVKMTMHAPKGFDWEVLNGPMAGTKFTNSYTPNGAKTKVNVAGDFKIQGMDDSTTKKAILDYLAMMFNEDQANLRRYK